MRKARKMYVIEYLTKNLCKTERCNPVGTGHGNARLIFQLDKSSLSIDSRELANEIQTNCFNCHCYFKHIKCAFDMDCRAKSMFQGQTDEGNIAIISGKLSPKDLTTIDRSLITFRCRRHSLTNQSFHFLSR